MTNPIDSSKLDSRRPYGEARRLAYFRLIGTELTMSKTVEHTIFETRLAKKGAVLRTDLNKYKRHTGIMRSAAVARGYLAYGRSLGFVRIRGSFVSQTGKSVFLASFEKRENYFELSQAEKIGYFFLIWPRLHDFRTIVSHLPDRGLISMTALGLRSGLKEHLVQSIIEWFVDLGLVKAISPTGGRFFPLPTTKSIKDARDRGRRWQFALHAYSKEILEADIEIPVEKPKKLWPLTLEAVRGMAKYVRSEVDPFLFAALPIILKVQNDLICKEKMYATLNDLIKWEIDECNDHGWIFDWNSLYGTGYIHAGGS